MPPETSRMTIRFKCPHCQKSLSVKDHLAGKKAACPVCKHAITIPTPKSEPVDVEAFAAEALADKPVEKVPEPVSTKTVDFICPFCDEELKLSADLAGKKTPCPKCTRVIAVPKLQEEKPRDWRTVQKKGPSGAIGNLPEQPDDAWSTSQKSKVSQQAMAEAGALPEAPARPLGAAGWARGIVKWGTVAGIAFLLISLIVSARRTKVTKDHLMEAKVHLPKMSPLLQMEYHRAAGEIDVRKFRASDAQDSFSRARHSFEKFAAEDAAAVHDRDLLLIRLVLSEAEMGADAGDVTLKTTKLVQRFDWKDNVVQREMAQTLEKMHSDEAKASALRQLACRFLEQNKLDIALSLANPLGGGVGHPPLLRAQCTSLRLVRDDNDAAQDMRPPESGKFNADLLSRVAYAQAHAFKKAYAEALSVAKSPGPAPDRLEACVAGAAIALADKKSKDAAAEAAPFIAEALIAYKEFPKDAKGKGPSWAVLELIRLGSRTGADVQPLVAQLPDVFKPRAQLDMLLARLDKSTQVEKSPPEEIKENTTARAFAWEALARHNTRLGNPGDVADVEEASRPFYHLGIALGREKEPPNK
jgi:hypothetical protein